MRDNGFKVVVANQDLYHWSNKELVDKWVKNKEYSAIGMGFLSARFVETVLPLCHEINKERKNIPLILGGPGATATPEYILTVKSIGYSK